MAQHTTTIYTCDKCGKKLKTCDNNMIIETDMSDEISPFWKRLQVIIKEKHGVHNSGEDNEAELCQPCAISLLTDALKRVRKGERVTAGVEEVDQKGWKS